MKNYFVLVLTVILMAAWAPSFAGCLATPAQVKAAQDLKAEAVQLREAGKLAEAAAKYEEAAKLHPQEVYAALYLLNAEGCLVGKWNPNKGYRYDAKKGAANKAAAQALLDQVKTLIDTVVANGCKFPAPSPKVKAEGWYKNAQDALNGVFH